MSVLFMSVFFLSVTSFVECQEVHTCPSKNGTLSCSLPDTFCCDYPDKPPCCSLWEKYLLELIIGVCAFVVLVVIICIICCCCCCKKRRRSPPVASPPVRDIELDKPVARTYSNNSMQNSTTVVNNSSMQNLQGFGNNNMQNSTTVVNNSSMQNLQGFGNSGRQNQPGFVNTANTETITTIQRQSSQQNILPQ